MTYKSQKLRIYICAALAVAVLLAVAGFAFLQYKSAATAQLTQARSHNLAASKKIYEFISNLRQSTQYRAEQEQLDIKNFCQVYTLPYEGFVCLVDSTGKTLVQPGNRTGSFSGAQISDYDQTNSRRIITLPADKTVEGLLHDVDDTYIMLALPLQNRQHLLFLQSRNAMLPELKKPLLPAAGLAVLLSLLVALIAYTLTAGFGRMAVSELEQIQQETQHAESTLQEARLKTKQLMHVIGHDLAIPFRSVEYFAEQLAAGNGNPAEVLNLLQRGARNGISVTQMALAYIKNEEGTSLRPEAVNLLACVAESAAMLNHRFNQKNIALDYNIDPGLKVMAHKNSLINIVLANIFSNALKFSHVDGTIRIKAVVSGVSVKLTVQDHGIGIPANILENLFNPQHPNIRKGTDGETGNGLGLFLARHYLEAAGGTIKVSSSQTESGAIVTLDLKAAL